MCDFEDQTYIPNYDTYNPEDDGKFCIENEQVLEKIGVRKITHESEEYNTLVLEVFNTPPGKNHNKPPLYDYKCLRCNDYTVVTHFWNPLCKWCNSLCRGFPPSWKSNCAQEIYKCDYNELLQCRSHFQQIFPKKFQECECKVCKNVCKGSSHCKNPPYRCSRNKSSLCFDHFKKMYPNSYQGCKCKHCVLSQRCYTCRRQHTTTICIATHCMNIVCQNCNHCGFCTFCKEYYKCKKCEGFLSEENATKCFKCLTKICRDCSRLFFVGLNISNKYICEKCTGTAKKYKKCRKVFKTKYNKYIARYMRDYLCDDLLNLIKTYIT